MSTQDEAGIEFSVIPEESQQHFRLLELPGDLLSIIRSVNPLILKLKSTEPATGQSKDSQAVLCTPDKTYNVRQVNTSNSVYVVRPTASTSASSTQPDLEAIAQCSSILELQPASAASAAAYIKAALPMYSSTGHHDGTKIGMSKDQLFSNIPLSDAECETAWLDLACFELQDEQQTTCLIPSSSAKLQTWKELLAAARAKGVDLTQTLDERDQAAFVSSSGFDGPAQLPAAVLHSLSLQRFNDGDAVKPDENKCAREVGQLVLKDMTETARGPVATSAFLEAWADLLPEQWRAKADLKSLDSHCRLENGGQEVTFIEHSGATASSANDGVAAAPEEAKSSLGAKRKWHEKFRAAKKTA